MNKCNIYKLKTNLSLSSNKDLVQISLYKPQNCSIAPNIFRSCFLHSKKIMTEISTSNVTTAIAKLFVNRKTSHGIHCCTVTIINSLDYSFLRTLYALINFFVDVFANRVNFEFDVRKYTRDI